MREDPTPEDLEALFRAEREAPIGPDAAARARVLAAVLDRTGGGGGGGGPAPTPPAPSAPVVPSLPTFAAISAASLAVGIALGAWGHASLGEPPEAPVRGAALAPVVAEEPAVVAEVGEVAGEVVEQDASDAGAPVVSAPRRARRDPRSVEPRAAPPALVETPPAGETHAEERSLIDRARVAVRRGSYHDALVSLMEHERRFASGELREERDRLVIEALIGERRTEPARRRIERYLRDYPSGLHRDDVERMAAGLR